MLASLAGGAFVGWVAMKVLIAKLETRVERLEDEFGDGDRGMRKRVHDHTSSLLKLDGRVAELEARKRRT